MGISDAHVEVLESHQRSRWEEVFELLPQNIRDINFSFEYNLLYEKNGDGSIRLFLYQEESSLFYYPFLLRSVSNEQGETEFKDIETVYGYTGPLSTSKDEHFLLNAIKSFKEYCAKENIVSEFIRFHPLRENHELLKMDSGLSIVPLREYVYVDLKKTEQEIWDNYTPQNRNKIRKAEKAGLRIETGFQDDSFDEFVSMYLENMRNVHAAQMYFFSVPFFNAVKDLVKKQGVFFTARLDGKVVGAAVFLGGKEIGHYFLAAASSEGKKIAAGNLLLHHGIKWSQQNGMKMLHLGGGVSEEADDPLLSFKRNFSAQTKKFYIGKRIHNQQAYSSLTTEWDQRFPEEAMKYKNILQRYRWTKADLVKNH